eukprot:168280-Lingulodinium_polyedra.AAC.1
MSSQNTVDPCCSAEIGSDSGSDTPDVSPSGDDREFSQGGEACHALAVVRTRGYDGNDADREVEVGDEFADAIRRLFIIAQAQCEGP